MTTASLGENGDPQVRMMSREADELVGKGEMLVTSSDVETDLFDLGEEGFLPVDQTLRRASEGRIGELVPDSEVTMVPGIDADILVESGCDKVIETLADRESLDTTGVVGESEDTSEDRWMGKFIGWLDERYRRWSSLGLVGLMG